MEGRDALEPTSVEVDRLYSFSHPENLLNVCSSGPIGHNVHLAYEPVDCKRSQLHAAIRKVVHRNILLQGVLQLTM